LYKNQSIKYHSILEQWQNVFSHRNFRIAFVTSIAILIFALMLYSKFLNLNETRNGVSFEDPFLSWFNPINVTWLIFTLIYGGLILGLINLVRYPKYLLIAIQTYFLIIFIRILAMYSLPLNPTPHTIPLIDPFVQLFGSGKILMKDLFFSGHTATMVMLFLTAPTKKLKKIFLAGVFLVGAAVLIQHTHYSVDVIAAPFFAYGCYRISLLFNLKFLWNVYSEKEVT